MESKKVEKNKPADLIVEDLKMSIAKLLNDSEVIPTVKLMIVNEIALDLNTKVRDVVNQLRENYNQELNKSEK